MISLKKGERVSLEKAAGSTLTAVRMGLGWDAKKKGGLLGGLLGGSAEIDLDASCVVLDASGAPLDVVWFRQLRSRDGSVVHSGDNLTGQGDGDDETISVSLTALPAQAQTLVFTVNSFRGQTFKEVENAFCRLVDAGTGKEIARYDLSGGENCTAMVMAKVSRDGAGWAMQAIGAPASGRTIDELMPVIRRSV